MLFALRGNVGSEELSGCFFLYGKMPWYVVAISAASARFRPYASFAV